MVWCSCIGLHTQIEADEGEAEAVEATSDIADLQAELLHIMDDLRDNNLAASRSSLNNIHGWKAFLEKATDAEVAFYPDPTKRGQFDALNFPWSQVDDM